MDSNGYLSTGDTNITEYAWDHRNRLTTVTDRATHQGAAMQTVEYTYDYQNRLITKTLDPDGDGSQLADETHFIHHGGQIVLQFDDNDALTHRYLWGPAVDQILADEAVDDGSPEDVLWTLTDHLNTVRDILDSDGNVENHLTYDAYGNITSETNAAIDHLFAFTGRLLDRATNLQNNLNRWYDPQVGRWLSEDPIPDDINPYRYVGNGPTNMVDPDGLKKIYKDGRYWKLVQLASQPNHELATAALQALREQYYGLTEFDPLPEEFLVDIGRAPGVFVSTRCISWGYGKYCGWSRRGPGKPIDVLDKACQAHDKCQSSWWTCNPYHILKCSITLCLAADTAQKNGCAASWPIKQPFFCKKRFSFRAV